MTTSVKTGYAPVNGLELYHEIRGSGDPLVLLHGGVVGMPMFDAILPELAGGRQVISVDLQGHGRTADIDRPLSFESTADHRRTHQAPRLRERRRHGPLAWWRGCSPG